ncbi:DNA adenine methylase [Mammaliicoccus sciuri]|uniref:DNA adenine methylase n=1 Tax=Mammaliicoccus sciuri TaxID=1296 RepID=UPI002DBFF393|nr:DNA adenine methylase [Mammaliicoccus sciuri]MEB6118717.1 DNA adenine methylase [Mammaliicoccus sciuri]
MKSKFPKVNYIGNKQKLTTWIKDSMPLNNESTILDLFSGGTSVSYELKKSGYRVISNDALYASFVISKAIIENKKVVLEPYHLTKVVDEPTTDEFNWLANKLYFEEETKELSQLISYSYKLNNYEKYIFLALLRRAMIRKLPYSRMNITWDNIVKLRDEEYSYQKYGRRRAYHNLSFTNLILADLENYNQSIFDNGKDNIASQLDALDAIEKYKDVADIIYIDPPYPGTMNKYDEFYGVFDQLFSREINYTNLTNNKSFIENFNKIIDSSSKFYRYAMISLNNNVKPGLDEILSILKKYGDLEITSRKHNYQISGKQNKNMNTEILAIVTFK